MERCHNSTRDSFDHSVLSICLVCQPAGTGGYLAMGFIHGMVSYDATLVPDEEFKMKDELIEFIPVSGTF